ncbi:unnamed protein product, partial [marine sediment metagenome]
AEKENKTLADGIEKVNNACVKIRWELEAKLEECRNLSDARRHWWDKAREKAEQLQAKLEAETKRAEEAEVNNLTNIREYDKLVEEIKQLKKQLAEAKK